MSQFDIDYHKRRLQEFSGKEWMPVVPSLEVAMVELKAAKAKLALVRSTMRALGFMTALSIMLILGGIVLSFVPFFRTEGPALAMIIPSFFVGVGAGVMRYYLGFNARPLLEIAVAGAEQQYRQQLEKACE